LVGIKRLGFAARFDGIHRQFAGAIFGIGTAPAEHIACAGFDAAEQIAAQLVRNTASDEISAFIAEIQGGAGWGVGDGKLADAFANAEAGFRLDVGWHLLTTK
jgi:hypothetical protein